MKWVILWIILNFCLGAFAQEKPAAGNAGGTAVTLEQYLASVKTNNPAARALVAAVEAAEVKIHRADLGVMPQAFGSYTAFDDRTPPLNPGFSPNKRSGYTWKLGVEQQTTIGLGANLYFENNQITLGGVNPGFFPINDYVSNRGVLELKQSLWRNSFGEQTRADLRAAKAMAASDLYNQKFKLKSLMLDAENAYWALVTYNQIVGLQEENVQRAKKLNDWMAQRVRMKLFDDVDGLQAQTAYESRLLELQTSLNDRAVMARQFNTMRGIDSDFVETLQELPNLDQINENMKTKLEVTREDFLALKEMAKAQENQARSSRSGYKPQVDLVASVASNGLNPQFNPAFDQIKDWDHPSWSVGLQVKFPLNFSLNSKLYNAASKDIQAGLDNAHDADFKLVRAWQEISKQQKEFQEVYNRAKRIEASQTTILSRERNRLSNGRTTTFQLLTIEQNLVTAQIQRTRAQLGLIQIRNMLTTFGAQ